MMTIHAKDEVPGKISTGERRRWQVIKQHEISGSANTQFTDTWKITTERAKDGIHNAGVVLKCQVQNQVSRHYPRIFKRQFVQQVRCLHLLHHIHTKSIVAQTDIDTSANHLLDRCESYSIVHI